MRSTFHNEEQMKAEMATIDFPVVTAPKILPKRRPGCRLQSTNLRKIAALAKNLTQGFTAAAKMDLFLLLDYLFDR